MSEVVAEVRVNTSQFSGEEGTVMMLRKIICN